MIKVVNEFQTVIKELLTGLTLFSDEQLNKSPFPESWTAGQVGDHLFKSFSAWIIIKGNTTSVERAYDLNCKPLSDLFLDYSIKMSVNPSDFNYPTNDYISKTKLITDIKKVTESIINFSNKCDLSLLCTDFEIVTAYDYPTRDQRRRQRSPAATQQNAGPGKQVHAVGGGRAQADRRAAA